MSMEERLLAKASELIDQRVAQIMEAPSAPRVRRLDQYIMIEANPKKAVTQTLPWAYLGQIQLSDNDVFVVPFVVDSYPGSCLNDGVLVEPTINGRSIFSENRPSFNRINDGGAIYLQKSWNLYVSDSGPSFDIRAEFVSCEIIQQGLLDPYPRQVGVVNWPVDATMGSEVSIPSPNCKSTTLIGTYTKDGQVYPGYSASNVRVVSYTDPLASASPPLVNSSLVAPFTTVRSLLNPITP